MLIIDHEHASEAFSRAGRKQPPPKARHAVVRVSRSLSSLPSLTRPSPFVASECSCCTSPSTSPSSKAGADDSVIPARHAAAGLYLGGHRAFNNTNKGKDRTILPARSTKNAIRRDAHDRRLDQLLGAGLDDHMDAPTDACDAAPAGAPAPAADLAAASAAATQEPRHRHDAELRTFFVLHGHYGRDHPLHAPPVAATGESLERGGNFYQRHLKLRRRAQKALAHLSRQPQNALRIRRYEHALVDLHENNIYRTEKSETDDAAAESLAPLPGARPEADGSVPPRALLALPARGGATDARDARATGARPKQAGGASLAGSKRAGRGSGPHVEARAARALLESTFAQWRGLVAGRRRARAQGGVEAATKLQARVRGWQSKVETRRLQSMKHARAAIKIQAAMRGRFVRVRATAARRSAQRAMKRKSVVPTGNTIISRSQAELERAKPAPPRKDDAREGAHKVLGGHRQRQRE